MATDDLIGADGIAQELGTAMRRQREKLGLSQELVAERIGCRQNVISETEAGEKIPSLRRLEQICRALRCKSSKLLPF